MGETISCCMLARDFSTHEYICSALTQKHRECGTKKCPFYKPNGCADWVRFESHGRTFIAPIEDRNNKKAWVEL